MHTSVTEMAELFAEHFTSMFVEDDGDPIPYCHDTDLTPRLADLEIDELSVFTTLRSMGLKFTVTPDGFPPYFSSAPSSRPPLGLRNLFSSSFASRFAREPYLKLGKKPTSHQSTRRRVLGLM